MNNKKVLIGLAAGIAALTAVGFFIAYRNKSASQRLHDGADDAAAHFKSKLQHLKRKASKEIKRVSESGDEMANSAKDRATQWVSKAGANL